jgi:hypothetical protein
MVTTGPRHRRCRGYPPTRHHGHAARTLILRLVVSAGTGDGESRRVPRLVAWTGIRGRVLDPHALRPGSLKEARGKLLTSARSHWRRPGGAATTRSRRMGPRHAAGLCWSRWASHDSTSGLDSGRSPGLRWRDIARVHRAQRKRSIAIGNRSGRTFRLPLVRLSRNLIVVKSRNITEPDLAYVKIVEISVKL